MKTYFRLLKYIKPHLGILISSSACMIISSVANNLSISAMIPAVSVVFGKQEIMLGSSPLPFVSKLVEFVNQIPRADLLKGILVLLVIGGFIRAFTTFFQSYLMNKVSYKTVRDIKNDLYEKMINLPVSFFSKSHTGDLVSNITYDTTIVRDCISEGVTDIVLQTANVLGAVVMLFILMRSFNIPKEMLLVIFILIPVIIFPVAKMGKRLKKISKENQEAMSDLNTALFEGVQGIGIVKAFGMEAYEKQKVQKINQRFYRLVMKSQKRITFVSPFTELVGVCCAAVIIGIGGHKVVMGQLDPGALVTFIAYILTIVKPFKRLTRVHLVNQRALAAAQRVFNVMDEKNTVVSAEDSIPLDEFHENIVFRNVGFVYPGKTTKVLNDVDFKVKRGEIIAIVGPSGVGKTTLVNLLPRFYDPTAGSISIDGIDLKNVTVESLRDKIGIVSQETFLFHDTIRNNIGYGQQNMPLAEVQHSAQLANAHDFIMKLPQQYDTVIGERGAQLSGGQRQRLSIARALLKNPPILILDEATSQLDTESEKQVQEAIDRLIENRTVFVIAHRLSTIKHANRILVVNDGCIEEQGTHEDLYKQSGLYKKLYDMQFSC